jgi:hypothetical protein
LKDEAVEIHNRLPVATKRNIANAFRTSEASVRAMGAVVVLHGPIEFVFRALIQSFGLLHSIAETLYGFQLFLEIHHSTFSARKRSQPVLAV